MIECPVAQRSQPLAAVSLNGSFDLEGLQQQLQLARPYVHRFKQLNGGHGLGPILEEPDDTLGEIGRRER